MTHFVDPDKCLQLNIRNAPKPGTVLATLPAGTNVTKIADHPTNPDWWQVDADLNGSIVNGFVAKRFLKAGSNVVVAPTMSGSIPPVHLKMNGKTRVMNGGRAFPLDEPSMPQRTAKTAAELVQIINYLEPDKSTHKRYLPGGGNTFCNIYAYDYAMRCNVYMPRVWWTDKALQMIASGTIPTVNYGTTVRELNANMLHDWFIDYGGLYGWRRVFDAGQLQADANNGKVCIIVAKRVNLSRSGHIVAAVPEHSGLTAGTNSGVVTRPVQSQAGSVNFTAKVPGNIWWAGAKFQSFGFWVCD